MVTIGEDGSAAPVREPPRSCRPRDWDTDWATAAEPASLANTPAFCWATELALQASVPAMTIVACAELW